MKLNKGNSIITLNIGQYKIELKFWVLLVQKSIGAHKYQSRPLSCKDDENLSTWTQKLLKIGL